MTEYRSSFLKLLDERGYIHQLTDAAALDALAATQVVPGYIGFDATAPSLHVGSLLQIMLLRRMQQGLRRLRRQRHLCARGRWWCTSRSS